MLQCSMIRTFFVHQDLAFDSECSNLFDAQIELLIEFLTDVFFPLVCRHVLNILFLVLAVCEFLVVSLSEQTDNLQEAVGHRLRTVLRNQRIVV